MSLSGLSDESRERLLSLAAFPPGAVVPYWLLGRLWGIGERRARIAGDHLVGHALALAAPADAGLRLDDGTREVVRRFAPDRPAAVSADVLDILRPPGGWHELAEDQLPFLNSLCFHLRQAGQNAELGELLLDMRLLVVRLAAFGPASLEADLASYGDTAALELAELLRQEGQLLTGGLSASDIELTLESRLAARPSLLAQLGHIERARPTRGLLASHALPDRADPALLRSLTVPVEVDRTGPFAVDWHLTGRYDLDWHPGGDHLAVVLGGPKLQIIAADSGTRTGVVELPDARMEHVRWSPDGTRLAVIDVRNRRTAPKWSMSNNPYGGHVLSVCDSRTGTEIDALKIPGPSPAFCWAPDSASVAVTGVTGVWLWRPGADEPPRPLPDDIIVQKWGHFLNPVESPDEDEWEDDDDPDWPRLLDVAVDWHPRHGLLAYARSSLLHWPDPDGPEQPDIWPVPRSYPAADVLWRPGGHTAALATSFATMVVDPLARQVRIRWPHGPGANGLRWSPDGSRLAVREQLNSMGGEALVRLWHIPADAELAQGAPPVQTSAIRLGPEHHQGILAWRPDGTAIAATETRKLIRLWRSDAAVDAEDEGPLALSYVTWSPDGTELAVRARDSRWFQVDPAQPHAGMRKCAPDPYARRDPAQQSRRLRDAGVFDDREPRSFDETPIYPTTVKFAPDERTFAVVDHVKRLLVFDPDGEHLIEQDLHPISRGHRIHVCFTSDSGNIVAAGRNNSRTSHYLAAWSLTRPTRESPAAEWRQHDHPASSGPAISFIERIVASRTHVAMIAYPGLIGLFALTDMRDLCWIRTNAPLRDAAFDPTGHRLAVVGDAGLYLFAVHDPEEF